jgi:hypothetical protein
LPAAAILFVYWAAGLRAPLEARALLPAAAILFVYWAAGLLAALCPAGPHVHSMIRIVLCCREVWVGMH